MSEHTPGLFAVDETSVRDMIYVRSNDTGNILARISMLIGINMTADEHRANARLFAAAPETKAQRDELLAALEAVEWVGRGENQYCPWCNQQHSGARYYRDHYDDCQRQAAIAKAQGGGE